MDAYPHHYRARAAGAPEDAVALESESLPALKSQSPPQFGGPGGQWSPETLFVAAVADCFVLTFRAIARASSFAWHDVACDAEGVLDRADGVVRFTEIKLHARLTVPAGANEDRARRLLEKAEKTCLVTNSLKVEPTLTTEVVSDV
jgi:peroxiredoxin-like protein